MEVDGRKYLKLIFEQLATVLSVQSVASAHL